MPAELNMNRWSRRAFLRHCAVGAAGFAASTTLAHNAVTALESEQGSAVPSLTQEKPLVFGHRGASALRPEHTLASYAKAIEDGADYIEPDLVCTKDGVLIARHEANLRETTDVAQRKEFSSRRSKKMIDGMLHEGWFVDDFTFAEIKTLRAIERIPKTRPLSAQFDGQFQVLSWEEIIDFVAAESATRGRVIGLIPELKSSTYFSGVGLPLEDRFLSILSAHSYTRQHPVEIQSFETSNLRALRRQLGHNANLRLMQLVIGEAVRPADIVAAGGNLTYAEMCTPKGLREMATYADVVAPPTRMIIPLGKSGELAQPSELVEHAHQAGLRIEPWTFRPENRFLAADFQNQAGPDHRNEAGSVAEMKRYLSVGIDGFFTDDPALGKLALLS